MKSILSPLIHPASLLGKRRFLSSFSQIPSRTSLISALAIFDLINLSISRFYATPSASPFCSLLRSILSHFCIGSLREGHSRVISPSHLSFFFFLTKRCRMKLELETASFYGKLEKALWAQCFGFKRELGCYIS